MSSLLISQATPLAQLTVAAAGIGAAYALVGTFTSSVIQLTIISTLDAAVQVSFDGTSDHIAVPAGSTVPVYFPIDFKSNNSYLVKPKVFVKEIGNPAAGSLYISAFSAAIM